MGLARTEYERVLACLRELAPADWSRPTECPGWDVHDMVGHVLGMAEMAASVVELMRQMGSATRRGGVFIDALTALQVAKHAGDTPEQLVAAFAEVAPKAAKGRRRAPGFVRRRTMPGDQPVGDRMEPWTFGFLVDVVLTRDPWMHRMDLARAVGTQPRLTADHDGVIVADVAAEWAGRHGQPCSLTLTGPAGGTWSWGSDGPSVEQDAAEFCRLLSGRGGPAGVLGVQVPF